MKKNPFQQFRHFLVRTRKYDTTATRSATEMGYDDEDSGTRLSGAFIIVLLLHVIAVVGVFAFARIKESRRLSTPPETSTQTAASKTGAAKQPATGGATASANAKLSVPPPGDTGKNLQAGAHGTHIVKEGETLTKIAFAYSIGVPELIAANKLKNQDDIRAGQPLSIPEPKQMAKATTTPDTKYPAVAPEKSSPTPSQKLAAPTPAKKLMKTYVVKKGDSAVKIARDHGCSYEELVKLNNIKDPKKIQAGQLLKLPPKNG
jgi:LysM repeat protein